MKVRNATNGDRVIVVPDFPVVEVKAGAITEDLPDELAKSLLDQPDNWQPVKSGKDKE